MLLTKGAEVYLPPHRDEHYVVIIDSSLPDLSEVKTTLREFEHVDATILVNAKPNLGVESKLTLSNLKDLFYVEDNFDKVIEVYKGY